MIVEDGTGFSNADSFATVAEAREFALSRGYSLPALDTELEELLIKATDFILQYEHKFQGLRSQTSQRLPFPRTGVVIYGVDAIKFDEIPQRLKEAQIRLAISANATELRPDGTGQEAIREKVGPLETEYSKTGTGTIMPVFNQAMDLLEPFFVNSGGGITVMRA